MCPLSFHTGSASFSQLDDCTKPGDVGGFLAVALIDDITRHEKRGLEGGAVQRDDELFAVGEEGVLIM